MNDELTDRQPGGSAEVRPSPHERCPECGEVLGNAWVCDKPDPGDPRRRLQHFSIEIKAGPVEPAADGPKRPARDFRDPDDVGVFFHSRCAPRAKAPEAIQDEVAKLFARAIWADYERTVTRWARVRPLAAADTDPPRCRADVASYEGRRVFTIARADWKRLRIHDGRVIEMELERVEAGSSVTRTSNHGRTRTRATLVSPLHGVLNEGR